MTARWVANEAGLGESAPEFMQVWGAVYGTLVFALGFVLLRWVFRRSSLARCPRTQERADHPDVEEWGRWGGVEVLLALGTGFATSLLVSAFRGDLLDGGPVAGMSAMALMLGSTCVVALFLVRRRDPGGWAAMGLVSDAPRAFGRSVLFGWGTYVVAFPMLLGTYLVWPALAGLIGWELEEQHILQSIIALDERELLIAVLLASLLNPFLEELVFRGFLQPLMIRAVGPVRGVVCTSVVFAAIHGRSVLLPVFALSLILGWIQFRTRRITAAWAAHGLHNGLTLALFLHPW